MEENMKEQNNANENAIEPKWLLPLAFVAISVVGYLGFAFMRDNYFDALSIPLIIGFIWVGVVKQKFALGIALAAFFMMLAIPAMSAGLMSWRILTIILEVVVLTTLSMGVYRLPLNKMAAMFLFFFLSISLLYTYDLVDKNTYFPLIVGGGAALLSRFLLAGNLAVSQ
jgi:hypothetical protein